MKSSHHIELTVQAQTDDTTCGPTCLEAVYRYFGHEVDLARLVTEVRSLPSGGTLAVWLGCDALERGFAADIYTYDLNLFDPTWFAGADIAACLREQRKHKRDRKLGLATDGFLEFLALGGRLLYQDLGGKLIRKILRRGHPILTGLCATYLYGSAREIDDEYDAIRGDPSGHFVVVRGYERKTREVSIADPLRGTHFPSHYYQVRIERLIAAILLGIVTYDANLLVIHPHDTG